MKVFDSEKNISNEDILLLENKINISLPESYKKFLLKYNGGYIEDNDYIDTLLSTKYGKSTIEYFIEIHNNTEKNLPDNYLPIGLDWSDNPITINLYDNSIVIFYFDEEGISEKIANSFEELLGVNSIDEL